MSDIAFKGFVALMVVLLLLVIAVAINEVMSDKITLTKNDWVCEKQETRLMPIMVNNVIMQQPYPVCVSYRRK